LSTFRCSGEVLDATSHYPRPYGVCMRSSRIVQAVTGSVAAVLLVVVGASPALAAKATSVSSTLSFSGSGTTLKAVTSVRFTSTYTGAYNVKYDVYRSTSSTKSSPVKVNTKSVFTKTLTTKKGTAYTYGPNTSNCAAGTTTYYYWIQGTVTDTSAGTVSFTSPVVAAKACTAL